MDNDLVVDTASVRGRPPRGVSFRARALGLFTGTMVAILSLGACESTRNAVGGDIFGPQADSTGRDTLNLPLVGSLYVSHENYPIDSSTAAGSATLLVGTAHDIAATALLTFPKVSGWEEYRTRRVNNVDVIDTLTFTPTTLLTDTLFLSFGAFVADSAPSVTIDGAFVDEHWGVSAPVTAPVPPTTGTWFSGVSLNVTSTDAEPIPTTEIAVAPSVLAPILQDSVAVAITAPAAPTMIGILSINSNLGIYSPLLKVEFTAAVHFSRADSSRDSTVARAYFAVYDAYRLTRTGPAPVLAPNPPFVVAAGPPSAFWAKINRFDIDGFANDSGVVEQRATVNSAVLEVELANNTNTFRQGSVQLALAALLEPYDPDSARADRLDYRGRILANVFQGGTIDTLNPNIRRFEIAELVNVWHRDSTANHGFVLFVEDEQVYSGSNDVMMTTVNAVEIVGMRLITIATRPPEIARRPTRAARRKE